MHLIIQLLIFLSSFFRYGHCHVFFLLSLCSSVPVPHLQNCSMSHRTVSWPCHNRQDYTVLLDWTNLQNKTAPVTREEEKTRDCDVFLLPMKTCFSFGRLCWIVTNWHWIVEKAARCRRQTNVKLWYIYNVGICFTLKHLYENWIYIYWKYYYSYLIMLPSIQTFLNVSKWDKKKEREHIKLMKWRKLVNHLHVEQGKLTIRQNSILPHHLSVPIYILPLNSYLFLFTFFKVPLERLSMRAQCDVNVGEGLQSKIKQ